MNAHPRSLWDLDPAVLHLNHGSFGAAPRRVLEHQAEWRTRIEANPVRFFARDLAPQLDAAREALSEFVGAAPAQLAFVANASTGVNAVLRSLDFTPGDELLVTNHGYGAASNAADYVAERSGATVVVADVPASPRTADDIAAPILAAASPSTRLALLDHVTSATGLVFPVAEIVAALESRGIPTLIDGAHAPGMLDLDVDAVGASYYVGNCHKWMCSPKGAGFLHVPKPEEADALVPVVVGWGRSTRPAGRSQFHSHFDWVGTSDPSAFLSVPAAIEVMGELFPGGWPELRERNHELALAGRQLVAHEIGVAVPIPGELHGSMTTVPLPPAAIPPTGATPDPLEQRLAEANVEVAVTHGPHPSDRQLRLSAQAYNTLDDYARLGQLL